MGRKNKKKNKLHLVGGREWEEKERNPSNLIVVRNKYNRAKFSRPEETIKIGDELFGGRYYCVGDQ